MWKIFKILERFFDFTKIRWKSGRDYGKNGESVGRKNPGAEREIEVCISGKRMEQMIMSLMPGAMILYMQLTSQGFMDVLYHNVAGIVVTVCLGIYCLSFWMGRKIVRISV